jgi:hypothetical protein
MGHDVLEDIGRGDDDNRCANRTSGYKYRGPGRTPEPRRLDETTSPIDRETRSRAKFTQDQHAAPGGGRGTGFGPEHISGFGRERDASGLLHRDILIAPLRGRSLAFPRPEQAQRLPGGGLGDCCATVFKRGRRG